MKDWSDVECEVCGKRFRKKGRVVIETPHPELLIAETVYCSKKCRKISEETENNVQNTCGDCGKVIKKTKGENGYRMDYKNRKMYPICDECTGK